MDYLVQESTTSTKHLMDPNFSSVHTKEEQELQASLSQLISSVCMYVSSRFSETNFGFAAHTRRQESTRVQERGGIVV